MVKLPHYIKLCHISPSGLHEFQTKNDSYIKLHEILQINYRGLPTEKYVLRPSEN